MSAPTMQEKAEARSKKMQETIKEKYPHAKPETLAWDAAHAKFSVLIKCTCCGDENRRVFTSDLFQVKTCVPCKSKAKAAKKAEEKAAMAEWRATQGK